MYWQDCHRRVKHVLQRNRKYIYSAVILKISFKKEGLLFLYKKKKINKKLHIFRNLMGKGYIFRGNKPVKNALPPFSVKRFICKEEKALHHS